MRITGLFILLTICSTTLFSQTRPKQINVNYKATGERYYHQPFNKNKFD